MLLSGTFNMLIWTFYNGLKGIVTMTVANALGVIIALCLIVAYLNASDMISDKNILITIVKQVDKIFF